MLNNVSQRQEIKTPFILWFTGLSGSGKSTLSQEVCEKFSDMNIRYEHLDGDAVRTIFPETGFSKEERILHNRRAGFIAGLLVKHGVSVICSFISPYKESREYVRENSKNFIEIYLSTPLDICESRDPKGLYKKVRRGEIKQFTGVDDPYEAPDSPEITIDTSNQSVDACAEVILHYLKEKELLK